LVKSTDPDLKSIGNAFLPIFALPFKSAFITVPLSYVKTAIEIILQYLYH